MARHHLVDESGNLDAAQRVHHDFPGLDDRVHPNRVEHEDKEATYLRGTPSGFALRRGQARAHRSRCRWASSRSAGMGSGGRGVRGAVAGRTEGAGPHLHLTHTSAGSVSFRRGCTPQNTSGSEQRTHSGAPAAPGGSGGAQPSTVAAGVPPAGTGALACQCVPCEKQGALPVERPWWGSGAAGGARTRARARPCSQTLACCLIEAFRNSCCETRALAFGRRDYCAERWWLADARLRLLKAEGAVDCVGLRSDAQLERGDCLVLYIEHTQHDRALRDRGRRQLAPSVTTSTS